MCIDSVIGLYYIALLRIFFSIFILYFSHKIAQKTFTSEC